MRTLLVLTLGTAAAADEPFEAAGYWRTAHQISDCAAISVLVIETAELQNAVSRLEKLCAQSKCAKAERPSWYYTGFDDIRTPNEFFYAVSPEKLEPLKRKVLKLGNALQVKRVPGRRLSLQDAARIREKKANLSREVKWLEGKKDELPGTLGLVRWELGELERLLQRDKDAGAREVLNVRLKEVR